MTTHEVNFERNIQDGKWRALCSCGWQHYGSEEEVQCRAAVHDIELVETASEET